ncbi:MAG: type IV secretory system conjugative DNA transfer family protein [Coriobacteriia bacterium]|nr:type IV secretory system conjugative DNA transfer family protein [Coriobacteriia bacterium]
MRGPHLARRLTFLGFGLALATAVVPRVVALLYYLKTVPPSGLAAPFVAWWQAPFAEAWAIAFTDERLRFITLVMLLIAAIVAWFASSPMLMAKGRATAGKYGPPAAGASEYGSARFQTDKERRDSVTLWDPAGVDPTTAGVALGVEIVGGKERYCLDADETHTLVLGTTGSGKTRRMVFQTIYALARGGDSMVLADPKGELFLSCKPYLEARGYDVVAMNFRDPAKSHGWNPLHKVVEAAGRDDTAAASLTAQEIATALVSASQPKTSDSFWTTTAAGAIAAVALYVALEAPDLEHKHLYGVYTMLGRLGRPVPDPAHPLRERIPLTDLMDTLSVTHPAAAAWLTAGIASERTQASIFTSALAALQIFADPNIASVTSGDKDRPQHDMRTVAERPTAVFLVIPDEREVYNVLASIYVRQLYQTLIEVANERGGRLDRRVTFILDEFGNIPAIPGFAQMLTVARGRGIRFVLAIQGIDQIEALYNKGSGTILGNCHTWIYLSTSHPPTAEMLEKMLGRYTIKTTSGGISQRVDMFSPLDPNRGAQSSRNESLAGRPLLMADEIRRWDPSDGAIVIRTRQLPAVFPAPDLSRLGANREYGLSDPTTTALILKEREDGLRRYPVEQPPVWLPGRKREETSRTGRLVP